MGDIYVGPVSGLWLLICRFLLYEDDCVAVVEVREECIPPVHSEWYEILGYGLFFASVQQEGDGFCFYADYLALMSVLHRYGLLSPIVYTPLSKHTALL